MQHDIVEIGDNSGNVEIQRDNLNGEIDERWKHMQISKRRYSKKKK